MSNRLQLCVVTLCQIYFLFRVKYQCLRHGCNRMPYPLHCLCIWVWHCCSGYSFSSFREQVTIVCFNCKSSSPISRKLADEHITIHCILILCWTNSCLNQSCVRTFGGHFVRIERQERPLPHSPTPFPLFVFIFIHTFLIVNYKDLSDNFNSHEYFFM